MFLGVRSRRRKQNPVVLSCLKVLQGNGINLFTELTHRHTHTQMEDRANGWVSREQWQALSGIQETDTMNLGNKNNLYKSLWFRKQVLKKYLLTEWWMSRTEMINQPSLKSILKLYTSLCSHLKDMSLLIMWKGSPALSINKLVFWFT